MNEEYITRLIYEYNTHLKGDRIEVPEFKRELYYEVERWLDKRQTIAIVGLRRTGKTTIMRQIMTKFEDQVSFFSFDEEETQKKEVLVFVIDYILNNFKSKYIFLDEIHYVADWEGVLKRYYDQKKNLKFVISGSESLELDRAKESLAGRLITFHLKPLNFREYLALRGKEIQIDKVALDNSRYIEELYAKFITEIEFFEHEFHEFLYKGAFPEIVNENDETIIKKYIYDLVVKKIIYRDIPLIFEIRRRDLLFDLFRYACENSSYLFNIKNLCDTFKADYETISNYLFYLESAFLIKVAQSYSKSPPKRVRRNKKLYAVHPSVAFAVLGYKKDMLIEKILGQYVESVFAGKYFWRDKNKNEVDLVIIQDGTIIPVEIKYQNLISNMDLRGLLKFIDKFQTEKGILITKKGLYKKTFSDKEVYFIPAWLAMLIY